MFGKKELTFNFDAQAMRIATAKAVIETKLSKEFKLHPALLALNPLKNKLDEEKNPNKKEAAKKMICAMESAILFQLASLQGLGNIHEISPHHISTLIYLQEYKEKPNFKQEFDAAVALARPILDEQSGWKKAIDYIANIILKLDIFSKEPSKKHFSFFAPPNRFEAEIEKVEEEIELKLNT
ncbi:Uncharacterised protein [Legionella beliardensis]|uniref:Uncharacterized protein n=1 Tax=Legionella beliardensis TaxID=91822 RepID=A0A378JSZ0_9GAMM|nr:hypothetical protein [Legionella beliardensis]STX55783.1 Uncharacterised protein [Legionella beliardensis]